MSGVAVIALLSSQKNPDESEAKSFIWKQSKEPERAEVLVLSEPSLKPVQCLHSSYIWKPTLYWFELDFLLPANYGHTALVC